MSHFQHFMNDPAKEALPHIVCSTKEEDPEQEGTFLTYCRVVNYLLSTCDTDDVFPKVEVEITNFKQTEGMLTVCNLELL